MGFAELFLIGVGLSMDAFAVSVCKGLNMYGTLNWRDTGLLALFFGGFQREWNQRHPDDPVDCRRHLRLCEASR